MSSGDKCANCHTDVDDCVCEWSTADMLDMQREIDRLKADVARLKSRKLHVKLCEMTARAETAERELAALREAVRWLSQLQPPLVEIHKGLIAHFDGWIDISEEHAQVLRRATT